MPHVVETVRIRPFYRRASSHSPSMAAAVLRPFCSERYAFVSFYFRVLIVFLRNGIGGRIGGFLRKEKRKQNAAIKGRVHGVLAETGRNQQADNSV